MAAKVKSAKKEPLRSLCRLCFYERPLEKAQLRKHIQEKHRYCTICGKTSPGIKDTARHRKVAHPKLLFRGRTPGVAESELLLPVVPRKTGDSKLLKLLRLQCVYCDWDKEERTKSRTEGDLEKHLEETHLVCQECGDIFANREILEAHITLVS